MEQKNLINYYFKNLDEALDQLFIDIFKKDDIFLTSYVVVPSSTYSSFIKNKFLKSHNEVLMNVQIVTFEKFILSAINCPNYFLADKKEVASLILDYLTKKNKDELGDIKDYILDKDDNFIAMNCYDFINTLSSLFSNYDDDLFTIDDNNYQKDIYDYVNFSLLKKRHLTIKQFITSKDISFNENISSVYFFGFTHISKLMEYFISIYTEQRKVYKYNLINVNVSELKENKLFLSSAPSPLKEVEYIHSLICSLLLKDNISYSDITVICRDIKKYEAAIKRTFDQDDINFAKLRYNLSSSFKEENDFYSLIKLLFDIKNKGYYTRSDFFNLINNSLIKEAKHLDDEFLDNIVDLLIKTKTYREIDNNKDFSFLNNRLLLSYFYFYEGLDSSLFKIDDKEYLPYSSLSVDSNALSTFIDIKNSLDSFLSIFKEDNYLSKSKIDSFKNIIDSFLKEDKSEIDQYKNFIDVIYNFSLPFDDCQRKVPFDLLFYYLLDNTKSRLKSTNAFMDGISFIEYNLDFVMPNKYVFFLGFNTFDYPKEYIKSELDLNNDTLDKVQLEKDIFNLYYLSSEHIYVSYLSTDLSTLEELYLSNIIKPYLTHFNIKENDIYKLDIDEKRSWKQLFTRNEYKNKDYYLAISSFKEEDMEIKQSSSIIFKNKKIKASIFKDYLSNPFITKINNIFSYENDDYIQLKNEYEPFELDSLEKYNSFIILLDYVLKNKIKDFTDDELNSIFNRLINAKAIPTITKEVSSSYIHELFKEIKDYLFMINHFTSGDIEIISLGEINIPLLIDDKMDMINIYFNKGYLRFINENDERYYFEKKYNINKTDYSQFLSIYVFSLIDIASLKDDDINKIYDIKLIRGYEEKIDKNNNVVLKENYYSFQIDIKTAREILKEIYLDLFDYSSLKFVPINILNKDISKYDNYDKYFNDITRDLSNFTYHNMFNKYDLGFSYDNFIKELQNEINKRKSLVLFIKDKENRKSEEIDG